MIFWQVMTVAENSAQNKKQSAPRSARAFYIASGVFLLYSLLLPLYTPLHFGIAAAVTLAAFLLADRGAPVAPQQEAQPQQVDTGDKQADALIKQGREDVQALESYQSILEDESAQQQLSRITAAASSILDYVTGKPDSASKVRQFLNYFLPTTRKLMKNYAVLAAQKVKGDNIGDSMQRIENMLGQIASAFEKQLDALFADTATDISADISVMQTMLNQSGLDEEDDQQGGGIKLQL